MIAAQIAVDPTPTIPNLGASGDCGCDGCVPGAVPARPAALLISLWLLIQMLNEVGSLVDMQSGGVAYVAGALFGATSAGLFSKPRALENGGPPWEPTAPFRRHL